MKAPLILDVRGNSLDDGPGIRTVIFFKGCPLSCLWCHNPESKKIGAELAFDDTKCSECDACIAICEKKALSRNNVTFVDRQKCSLCFRCTEICPSGALSRVGKEMSIDEIMAKIVLDVPFYKNSGGGVTLSGGEPMLFMDFSSQLLQECKKKNIHTLIETSGYFEWNQFEEKILPWTDMIYYDIKLMDSELHRKYCGVNNEMILINFEKLAEISKKEKIGLLARTPLVPNITDTKQNLLEIAKYLAKVGITKAALLPYNPLWRKKSEKLGICNKNGVLESESWMNKDRIEECKGIYGQWGIEV